ncbi:MAG TPA: TlpA disulfide reductase family protein, partial [Pyrinomonadaceae bacterium]|nr:TlpA disulfide reductase family protein [Pyrinomonadaceae bacterium]
KCWRQLYIIAAAAVIVLVTASMISAQAKAPTGKTIFRDSAGNLISNNEFVDIRMANFHYPDATVMKTLEDGTVEFRLQKIPQEGMAAPDFSVKTVDGKTLSLADLKGKVIVLSFWFIGCPACIDLEPKLNNFKSKFSDNDQIVFLAMTADSAGDVRKYLSRERFDYIQAVEAKDALQSFTFAGYPKNIVIGKSGEIAYWRSTIKAWDKFESVVRAELENK